MGNRCFLCVRRDTVIVPTIKNGSNIVFECSFLYTQNQLTQETIAMWRVIYNINSISVEIWT